MRRAQWSILTYIAAHNNLQTFGDRSLGQIWRTGSSDQVKLTVLLDTAAGARRYASTGPGEGEVADLSDFDSGDGKKLAQVAKWAFEKHPAERYGLVLWSHGTGWMPDEIAAVARSARGDAAVDLDEARERSGASASTALFRSTLEAILSQDTPQERAICFDDGSQHALDTLELERVAGRIQGFIGQPLDLLGMDACLMASLEVAYQLRHSVRAMVASEELVPVKSWPYDTILGALRSHPDMSARDLAAQVVADYGDYYDAHPPEFNRGDVTKVALDLSRIGEAANAAGALGDALLADIGPQRQALWAAQARAMKKETQNDKRQPSKFSLHLWDAGTLARELGRASQDAAVRAAAGALQAALAPGGAVIAERHRGSWFDGLAGVSLYAVPPNISRISPFYPTMAFAQDTRWGSLLSAYHQDV
jgi:hypothetical protein